MVGAEGFEPPTLCSQSRCATRLRYAPTFCLDCSANRVSVGFEREHLAAGQPEQQPHHQRQGDGEDQRQGTGQQEQKHPVLPVVAARFG